MSDENPYRPPQTPAPPAPEAIQVKSAGALARILSLGLMICFVPGGIGMLWSGRSFTDYAMSGLIILVGCEFGHVAFTGRLYPKSLND